MSTNVDLHCYSGLFSIAMLASSKSEDKLFRVDHVYAKSTCRDMCDKRMAVGREEVYWSRQFECSADSLDSA